ncbi:hypothetical protein WJX75_003847 [Coccomyxa subellipsoidea]|uniref:non-specific serine/threonine protein kinase n=1 Tax=Coccomyxa subellipsoidea TaxID=248742 RepID=A0ABR2YF17_9CHLO
MQKLPGPGPRIAANSSKAVRRKPKKVVRKGPPSNQSAQRHDSGSESAGSDEDSEDEGTEGYRKGGYHPVRIGEKYKDGRYVVLRKLGWGHFSTVWLVQDTKTGVEAALKVQKSAQHYTEAARDEITLLTQIKDGDPENEKHCVRLYDWFEHTGAHGRHICMVFEVLGDNLLALIKVYNYRGVPLPLVKHITKQVLVGIDYMHTKLNIIHTDLKPENVMLTEAIRPRKWLQPVNTAAAPARSADAPSAAPAASNANPEGHLAAAAAAGQALTKNQKKKLKKKLKKVGSAPADSEADSQQTGNDSDVTSGAAVSASAESDLRDHGLENSEAARGDGVQAGSQAEAGDQYDGRGDDGEGREPATAGLEEQLLAADAKVVDFGNACWTYKQFTSDVQTRQYRCPEVLLGAKYSTPADMWSLACMVFELVTGDLLFDPRSGKDYDRDEDHLALFMELLGKMPRKIAGTGKYAKDFFNRHGELRHIKKLRYWPLEAVLQEKYDMAEAEAQLLADFLQPMLEYVPERRATAAEMLQHPWLQIAPQTRSRSRSAVSSATAVPAAPDVRPEERTRRRPTQFDSDRPGSPHAKRSRSPSPSPAPRHPRIESGELHASLQSSGTLDAAATSAEQPSSLASSGVLLSPSSPVDGLSASTVLVSKGDVASRPVTPAKALTRRSTADGSEAAEQEWQIL